MIVGAMDELRTDRAKFAREVEYLKENVQEELEDMCMESAESMYFGTTTEELEEAAVIVDSMSLDDEALTESTEVERILVSESDLSFEEMIGLE